MAAPREPTSKPDDLQAANSIAVQLYRQISKSQTDNTKNLVLSPPVILLGLYEIYLGSHGKTKDELEKLFNAKPEKLAAVLEDIEDIMKHGKKTEERDYDFFGGSKVVLGNAGVEVDRSYREKLRKLLGEDGITTADFQDKNEIEVLMGSMTNQRISTLAQDVEKIKGDKSSLLLLSLAHFTSDWENKFMKKITATYENQMNESFKELLSTVEEFHNADGTTSNVVMVHLEEKIFLTRDEDLKVTIAEIPLEKYTMNIIIVVPDDEKKGLKNFEEKFNEKTFDILRKNWQMPLTHVYLPKFSLESHLSLSKPLQNLGVKQAFSSLAELSEISGSSKLHVEDLIHASSIDISCECGKAVPPRKTRPGECSVMRPSEFATGFHVNRPFFFLVQPRHPELWCMMGKVQHIPQDASHNAFHVRSHHKRQQPEQ